MNQIQTETKGIRPIKYNSNHNGLSYYTYLKDCRYQVKAHFIWNENRPELADDRNENKHHNMIDGIHNIPFLKNLNLKEYLEMRTELPVRVLNDVKAAALGEKWVGTGRNCENFFCMTIGTGIGGCLVIDSHVFEGTHFRAGEIGYLDYEDERNFFEKRSSTKGLIEIAQLELGLPDISGGKFLRKFGKMTQMKWLFTIAGFLAS